MEQHILDAINAWIQPYDDGSLPNIDISFLLQKLTEFSLILI